MKRRVMTGLVLAASLAATSCLALDVAREAVRPCPGYAAGFVRVPGSPTCIRLSGRAAVGADLRAGRDRAVAAPAAAGRFAIDTRTESDLGPVRTYVRIGNGRR